MTPPSSSHRLYSVRGGAALLAWVRRHSSAVAALHVSSSGASVVAARPSSAASGLVRKINAASTPARPGDGADSAVGVARAIAIAIAIASPASTSAVTG